jgi:hypothetical protein
MDKYAGVPGISSSTQRLPRAFWCSAFQILVFGKGYSIEYQVVSGGWQTSRTVRGLCANRYDISLQVIILLIFAIGPRELIVFDPAALNPLLGFTSKARKGPFYGAMEQSLHTTRDHDFHKRRRKIWDIAFKQSERIPRLVLNVG